MSLWWDLSFLFPGLLYLREQLHSPLKYCVLFCDFCSSQENILSAVPTTSRSRFWRTCRGQGKRPEKREGIGKQSQWNTKVQHWFSRSKNVKFLKSYSAAFLEMADGGSSSSPENGLKPCVDHKIKNHPRTEKLLNHSGRVSHEFHGQSSSTQGSGQNQKCHTSPTHPDEDGCPEQWDKCCSSHNKSKSSWRPIREVLNVDNVLNELEQRRQQQLDSPRRSKPSTQDRTHPEPSRGRDREFLRSRDDRRQKCLMTIYEDELRHETESHSSVESESKASQQKCSKLRSGPKTLLHSETWTIQRTESGYESSDRLSSGSTNPDSPGVEGFASKESRLTPETQQQR